jgi:hypothetical protein
LRCDTSVGPFPHIEEFFLSAQVQPLRDLLEQRFPSAVPLRGRTGLAQETGVGALDRALPGGGLPRGRLTSWAPTTGTTAVLRAVCYRVVSRGERAVWIDAAGTTIGDGWAPGPLLVRPRSAAQALESAEEMLRSAGAALVVMTGCRVADAERLRLVQAAREGGAALVVVEDRRLRADVRVTTSVSPTDFRWMCNAHGEPACVAAVTIHAHIMAPGWDRRGAFTLSVLQHELRLSLEPSLADRRGNAR